MTRCAVPGPICHIPVRFLRNVQSLPPSTGALSIAAPIAMHRRMVVRSLRYSHRRPSTRSGVAPTAPTGCGEARCGRSYSALPPESRPNPKRIKSEGSPVAIRETEAHIQLQFRPAGFTTAMTPSVAMNRGIAESRPHSTAWRAEDAPRHHKPCSHDHESR